VPVPYSGYASDPNLSIPLHTVTGTSITYGVDRGENPSYAMAGLLREIQNGYGGKISFSYGAHSTNASPLLPLPADDYYFGEGGNDGVRLEAITESDVYHPGNQKHTTFTYYGGQRFLDGGYFHYPKNISGVGGHTGTMTSTFVTPHQFVNGSNHGYSRVVMTAQDENGQMLSRKEVGFTNFSDSLSGYQPRYLCVGGGRHFYEFPYTDKQYLRDWEMGLLLYSIDYDQDGNILEKTVHSYNFDIDSTSAADKGVAGAKTSFLMDYNQPALPSTVSGYNFAVPRVAVTDPYKPFNGTALLANTTTYKYFSDNSYVTDAISYSYDGFKNLKRTTTFNSQGEEIDHPVLQLRCSGTGLLIYALPRPGDTRRLPALEARGSRRYAAKRRTAGRLFQRHEHAGPRKEPIPAGQPQPAKL